MFIGKERLNQNIRDTVFIVTDVETTGLNPYLHRITEIALIKVINGEIVDEYSALVDPCQFIPPYITRLTGITNEMVYGKPKFEQIIPDIYKFMNIRSRLKGFEDEMVVLTGHNIVFDHKFIDCSFSRAGVRKINFKPLCTCRLARRLYKAFPSKSLQNLSKYLGIKNINRHRAMGDARTAALILIDILDKLVYEYEIETLAELLSFQYKKIYDIEKIPARLRDIKVDLKHVPKESGVYYFYSKNGTLLYVGKAKNLKDRVSSYFYHNTSHSRKVKNLIRHIQSIDYEITASELSALILESETIKKHKPKYNTALRRYKRFPFIKIDSQNEYPRVYKVYELKPDGASYYGPFISSMTVNTIIERINKTFYNRKCNDRKLKPEKSRSHCMYYEIGQCKAPCNFTQSKQEYKKEITKVDEFILSPESGILKHFQNEMKDCSEKLLFEEAANIRDKITDLKKVLINMELTHTAVSQKNYILKCKNEERFSYELFFIVNGRLAFTKSVNNNTEVETQKEEILNLADELYFGGSLFGKVNNFEKTEYSPSELDKIKIIMNWICRRNRNTSIIKINEKTKIKDMIKFFEFNNIGKKSVLIRN